MGKVYTMCNFDLEIETIKAEASVHEIGSEICRLRLERFALASRLCDALNANNKHEVERLAAELEQKGESIEEMCQQLTDKQEAADELVHELMDVAVARLREKAEESRARRTDERWLGGTYHSDYYDSL